MLKKDKDDRGHSKFLTISQARRKTVLFYFAVLSPNSLEICHCVLVILVPKCPLFLLQPYCV